MEEKVYAVLNDFIGIDPKESNKLVKKGIVPGDFFLVKSVEVDGKNFKTIVEVEKDGKKFEEIFDGKNVSLYKRYDADDVKKYDPLTDESLKKSNQIERE